MFAVVVSVVGVVVVVAVLLLLIVVVVDVCLDGVTWPGEIDVDCLTSSVAINFGDLFCSACYKIEISDIL